MLARIYVGHHILIYGLAWIPIVYYFFFKLTVFDKPNLSNAVWLSVVSALFYFTGDIYHFIMVYTILAIFFLYYAVTGHLSRQVVTCLAVSVLLTAMVIGIKVIPDYNVSGQITRSYFGVGGVVTEINPTDGGGFLEESLSSFVFGTGIDGWGYWESSVFIGVIPILLAVLACVYGKREIVVPMFLAVIASLVYASGGKSLLSFIHYTPLFDLLRCPGRVFGAMLPILVFLALYGAVIAYSKIKNCESFELTHNQKISVIIGLTLIVLIKGFELPFQQLLSPTSAVSAILIVNFIILLLFQSGNRTSRNIIGYLTVSACINVLLIVWVYSTAKLDIVKLCVVTAVLLGIFVYSLLRNNARRELASTVFCGILIISVFTVIFGNLCAGNVTSFDPGFEKSAAPEIISLMKTISPDTPQLWVYETGFYFYHYDFTYWDVMSGVHPIATYSAYVLKTAPSLTYAVGNTTYSTVDYIVDTQYLENGNQNIPEYTFKVQNISVYAPTPVLPTAFFIRDNAMHPVTVTEFSTDKIVVTGDMHYGDTVVLKTAYYPGWTVNGVSAVSVGNMTGGNLASDTNTVEFKFDPVDYKTGIVLTACGIISCIVLLLYRKRNP
jgi:hypothetical protein